MGGGGLYARPLSAGSMGPKATWVLQASLGQRTQERGTGGAGAASVVPSIRGRSSWTHGREAVAPCAGPLMLFIPEIVRGLMMEAPFPTPTPSPKQSWYPALQTGPRDIAPVDSVGGSVVSIQAHGGSGSSF